MNDKWKKILGAVAPTIATALGGPLAGTAVTAIAKALDKPSATEDEVAAIVSSGDPELLLKLKTAEREFSAKMRELDIEIEKISTSDRASARQLAIETKSRTPEILSWLVVAATLTLEGWIMLNGIPDDVSDLVAGRILGMLDTAFATVLAFWLGTSHSSRFKDETISRMAK